MDAQLQQIEQFFRQNGGSKYFDYFFQSRYPLITAGTVRLVLAFGDNALERLTKATGKSIQEIFTIPEGISILENSLSVNPLPQTDPAQPLDPNLPRIPVYTAINGTTYGLKIADLEQLKLVAAKKWTNFSINIIDAIVFMPTQLENLRAAKIHQPTIIHQPITIPQPSIPMQPTPQIQPIIPVQPTITIPSVKSKKLYTFGRGAEGQLGTGDRNNRGTPYEVHGIGTPSMVTCGDKHTSIVVNGQLYISGNIGNVNYDNKEEKTTFFLIEGLNNISFLAAGGNNTAAIIDGNLYMFGSAQYDQLSIAARTDPIRPVLVDGISNVTYVACGRYHTALISNGELYTFGSNRDGALGLPELNSVLSSYTKRPTRVSGLNNVTMVSCSDRHTAVIADGRLYTFGTLNTNALGYTRPPNILETTQIQYAPKLVEAIGNVSFVACDRSDTMVISEGKVYNIGARFKTFDTPKEDIGKPMLIKELSEIKNISFIALADLHMAILSKGKVYTRGYGSSGELGYPFDLYHDGQKSRPVNLNGVIAISCGYNFTAVIAD